MTTKYPLLLVLALAAACGDNHKPNLPPTVADVSVSTAEDTPVAITVSPEDANGDALEVTFATPSHGTLAGTGTSVTYTPHANFAGKETFTVTVSDGKASATATISVTVNPVDDAPVAGNDTATTDENVPLTLAAATLLANDTEVDGQTLTITGVSSAVSGTVVLAGTTVTFTPTADFSGTARFQYTVSDGTLTATATVTVTVNMVNDAPVATDDTATTDEDVPLTLATSTLLANDTDPEGQTLTITGVSGAVSGTVALAGTTVTFTPTADFSGTARFQYTVSDGSLTATATVTVTVSPVDDAPVATDDTATTDEDVPLALATSTLLANDTDPEGQTLTITGVSGAVSGTVALAGTTVTFTPTADFSGTARFQYTVSDGSLTATATVTVTVNPVNDPPVTTDDTATTDEDVTLTLAATTLLANDTDVDGQTLTISAVQNPSNGVATLSGTTLTFTPNANFNGTAAFEYVATDGLATRIGLVTVTVNPINDAPVATDATVRVAQNTSTTVTLRATDVDGDALSFTIATPPAQGTLAGTGANQTYAPAADFAGQDSFTFTVSDGTLTSNTATVSITVYPPFVCGDGNLEPGEVCDDGNRVAGDGCRADCRGLEVCGDGLVDSVAGEQCDDGGTASGDGCDASCQLDAFSSVPPTLISGALSCRTNNSNTGRKVAVDALGRFFVVMNCGGTGYVSVSRDRGQTWVGPTSLGITGVAEIAIEGGPTGTAYVSALASPGKLIFTRTTDAGETWETPREISAVVEAEVSMDSLGDALYMSFSMNSTNLRILRNSARGEGSFIVTDVAQANSFHELIVDKISGDVFSVSDNPAFHIRRSSDAGATFGAESAPPGQAFFSDWTGSNSFLYTTGTNGDDNIDVIPVSAPGTSTQVHGLPTDVGPGPLRSIDADALGNAYVVTQRNTGNIQLDRMLFGASSVAQADARTLGAGSAPAVAALPSNTGALVAYTNGTSVYGAVVVY
ncbi:tandem-95 repeat protein [Hyalangium minutum]|uniref:RTX toxin n=1 Tax=Hyalangium minutum TaxID=394096 RepID=A0A085WHZ5_9BACT|nr:Ig-like domain-containing protein [Hyalangium minutum]KFE67308.1 RTX toxin [Hyalangium minutum]KFE67395.1 RTX toxin [Hyalangium minutum]